MHRALLIVAALAAAVATIAIGLDMPAPEAPTAKPTAEAPRVAAEPIAATDAAPTTPARSWVPGRRHTYDADFAVWLGLDGDTPDAGDAPMVSLSGVWQVTVLRADAEIILRAELAGAALSPADYLDRPADLARPFQLKLARDGRLLEAAFAPDVGPAARQLLRQLAATTQLTHRRGRADWTVDEADTTGRYRADYRLDGDTVERVKRAYHSVTTGEGPGPVPAGFELDASTTFTLGADGHPRRIRATARLGVPGTDALPTVRTLAEARFDLRGVDRGVARLPGTMVAEGIAAAMGDDPRETERLDRDLVKAHPFADLVDAVHAADDLDDSAARGVRIDALPRLAGHFRLDAEHLEAAMQIITDADTSEAAMGTLVAALGATGTDASRDALLELVDAGQAEAVRHHAITALQVMENADGETIAALTTLMDDDDAGIAGAATLALGGSARQAVDFDDVDPVQVLLDRYAAATTAAEKGLLIDALGNAGDPRGWPAIRDALGTELNDRALFALRFLPVAEVDALLLTALNQSTAAPARQAVLSVIAYRDAATWQPVLAELLAAETDEAMQQAIRALL